MKVSIREGNTGILYITKDNGGEDRYIPDYDLKGSNRLLQEFYKLQSNDAKSIKDSFWKDGINWFPTTIALLHWHILYMYVKYRAFFEKYPMKKYEYIFTNKIRLSKFVSLISSYDGNRQESAFQRLKFWKHKIASWLIKLNNQRALRLHPQCSILFFRYGLDDFRTKEVKSCLDELEIQYIQTIYPTRRLLFRNLLSVKPKPLFFLKNEVVPDKTWRLFVIPEKFDPMLKKVLQTAVLAIQDRIHEFQATYDLLKESLKNAPFTKLYGIDDTNYLYPMIYACQANGIETIGHQHGSNYSPWDAPYNLKGFREGEYQWFDKVLVWGAYWRDLILSNSSCYSKEQIKVGTSMRSVLRSKTPDVCGSKATKNILIPYEFYADTYVVGKYICALQDLGYTIYFKWREDEKLEDEIEAYCLPKKREKQLIVVKKITDELMAKIDIIAGCCSTLIFDLLPGMKETWILETKFIFGEYLVDEGIAKKIRLEHLEEDIHRPVLRRIDQELVNYVFSQESLKDVLQRELW